MSTEQDNAVVNIYVPKATQEQITREVNEKAAELEQDIVDWWYGTVAFSIFPILLAALMGFLRNGVFDLIKVINGGELILCAFSVSIPSLISQYNRRGRLKRKWPYYVSLIIACTEVFSYAVIKTNQVNIPWVVYWTSGFCVFSSVVVGFFGESKLKVVRKNGR